MRVSFHDRLQPVIRSTTLKSDDISRLLHIVRLYEEKAARRRLKYVPRYMGQTLLNFLCNGLRGDAECE